MKTPKTITSLFITLGLTLACSDPAELIANHFESMANLSEVEGKSCQELGVSLNEYLSANQDDLSANAKKMGESNAAQARRIDIASKRIDKVVEGCGDSKEMITFKRSLAKVVLDATGL